MLILSALAINSDVPTAKDQLVKIDQKEKF